MNNNFNERSFGTFLYLRFFYYRIFLLFLILGQVSPYVVGVNVLNRNDIDFNERECIVFGKGNKERVVYFDARTKIHLQNYINSRTDDNLALFVSLKAPNERLKIGGIETRLREFGKQLGLHKVHPHKFRRTLATMAIDKGMPIEQLQQHLGHRKIDTTLQYAMVKQSNVKLHIGNISDKEKRMETKKLIDCCEFISDGDHLPPPKSDIGVPFITISNITGQNKLSFEDTMFVPESYYNGLNENKKAQKGDILYSVVGSFGKPVYVDFDKQMVFQRHIAILRPKRNVNARFIYYTLLNPQFYKLVDKLATLW